MSFIKKVCASYQLVENIEAKVIPVDFRKAHQALKDLENQEWREQSCKERFEQLKNTLRKIDDLVQELRKIEKQAKLQVIK